MDTVGPVYERLRSMLPEQARFGLGLRQHPSAGVVLELDVIEIPTSHRGQGIGNRVLIDLARTADENGWTLTLRISTDLNDNPERLDAWYARYGFTVDRSQIAGAWRIRKPQEPMPI